LRLASGRYDTLPPHCLRDGTIVRPIRWTKAGTELWIVGWPESMRWDFVAFVIGLDQQRK
jgi:hypothetical protein